MSDRNAPELTRPRAPWLSAVAIMRNEETNLPGLFATLRGRVGELILVDDSSTDRSLELAAAEGAWVRVIAHSMTPDGGFAGQRNIGLDAARGSWALHMDCDERLSPELFEELCRVLPETPHNGMRYRRINYFLHRPMGHGGWNTWNRPQIARIGHHRFEGRLHETCVIEGAAAMTGQLQHPMHHLNDVDLTQRLRKSEKYVGMDAERLAESRRRVRGSELVWRDRKSVV